MDPAFLRPTLRPERFKHYLLPSRKPIACSGKVWTASRIQLVFTLALLLLAPISSKSEQIAPPSTQLQSAFPEFEPFEFPPASPGTLSAEPDRAESAPVPNSADTLDDDDDSEDPPDDLPQSPERPSF